MGHEGDRSVYCGEARVEVPLRGKKILGVRLCPHWPAQLKLTDVSLHGQLCHLKDTSRWCKEVSSGGGGKERSRDRIDILQRGFDS